MIRVRNLGKRYEEEGGGLDALRGISLKIDRGEFAAIMGPSGSGKSTLMHILGFLDRPTAGSYAFLDKSINNLSNRELAGIRNREMGFVFQAFNLLGRSSVAQNVEIPLLYNDSIPAHQRRFLVEEAIRAVGLSEKIDAEAGKLSGGQKQRVAIARAIVGNPSVIFADEPTGNLDSASGSQIMGLLKRFHREGKTIILVTHETYTAAFAERLIRLKDGKVEFDGPMPRDNGVGEKFFK